MNRDIDLSCLGKYNNTNSHLEKSVMWETGLKKFYTEENTEDLHIGHAALVVFTPHKGKWPKDGEQRQKMISPLALLVWTRARSQISWSALSGVRSWIRTKALSGSHTNAHMDIFITSKGTFLPPPPLHKESPHPPAPPPPPPPRTHPPQAERHVKEHACACVDVCTIKRSNYRRA